MKLPKALLDFTEKMVPSETVVIGLGNSDRADDGFGLRVAAELKMGIPNQVFSEADRCVENIVIDLVESSQYTTYLFVDAANFGGDPGDLHLFGPGDANRFSPAFSTHKVPITFLMDMIVNHGGSAYLLALQPVSLEMFGMMSSVAASAANRLTAILNQFFL